MHLDLRSRWQRAIDALRPPRLYFFFVVFVSYFFLNLAVNQFDEIVPFFLSYNLAFVIPYALLTLFIGILVALNLTLIVYKLRMLSFTRKESGMTVLGMAGGFLGGACPGCFVGLFPTLAGAFGVTATLSSLPFLGFEIQIPTAAILLLTSFFLTGDNTCKVTIAAQKKGEHA